MGYIDPGAFGLVSQIGYVVLFTAVSAFLFFFRPLKFVVNKLLRRQRNSKNCKEDEIQTR